MRVLVLVVVLSGCTHVRQTAEIARDAYIVAGLVERLQEPDDDANEAAEEVSDPTPNAIESCDACPPDETCFYRHTMCPAITGQP
jgi:hypothetical protein